MSQLIDNPMEYLRNRDTIVTDHSMSYVRIGSLKDTSIDNILRLCASHYLFSITNLLLNLDSSLKYSSPLSSVKFEMVEDEHNFSVKSAGVK